MRLQKLAFLISMSVVVLAVLAAGCGAAPQPAQPAPTATPRQPATPTPTTIPSPVPIPDALDEATDEARADLATRLQVPLEEISLVEMARVEWPDTSLGCAEPGRMYAEVVTPGHIIVLSAGGKTYEYHRPEDGGEAVLCDRKGDQPVPSVKTPKDAEKIVALAKAHLADRIGVSVSEIEVAEVEAVEWRDSSLGCPEPGSMYLQVITPGFRIALEAGGVQYAYHSDSRDRVIPCKPVPQKRPLGAATPSGPMSPVDIAQRHLAGQEGVALEEIEVVSVEDVDWPDASLGCPQPGMMYAQVITPGKRVLLGIGPARYEYHTDRAKRAVLCWSDR